MKINKKATIKIVEKISKIYDILMLSASSFKKVDPKYFASGALALRGINIVSSIFSDDEPCAVAPDPFKDWTKLHCGSFLQDEFFCILRDNYSFTYEKINSQLSLTFNHPISKIGILKNNDIVKQIYIEDSSKIEEIQSSLSEFIWNKNGKHLAVSEREIKIESDHFQKQYFFVSNKIQLKNSDESNLLFNRFNQFLQSVENRSIVFLGRPGTGKTTAIASIINKLDFRSIHIDHKIIGWRGKNDIISMIEILKPESVIIDDFDRIDYLDSILGEIETINKNTKLFIVSVNSINRISPAILRPGRFDEIINFDDLSSVIKEKIEIYPLDVQNRLIKLPIAFVNEFEKRVKVLGLEQSIFELYELEMRAKRTNEIYKSEKEEEEEEKEE